jgi:hypothetical protein
VVLRDMARGEQSQVSPDEAIGRLKAGSAGPAGG